jgi:hypothetical protein
MRAAVVGYDVETQCREPADDASATGAVVGDAVQVNQRAAMGLGGRRARPSPEPDVSAIEARRRTPVWRRHLNATPPRMQDRTGARRRQLA